ncbi:MAG: glycosyltransferase family 2 protein [Planctomycetota bacterium]|jgi:glycosyltransferase involved in cell wall biosynthesis|nr:glycosyltransferase family 2 protein [Planctomycetota bacterium]
MSTLAAVIITCNEEKNIARCLRSLQAVADEIVVVDSGSTDRTAEICRSFGVKFVSQPWLGYGAQKNFADTLATGDWRLSLDADEELSAALRRSILAVKESASADAYACNRHTNYCGRWINHCGWYPDAKIRLWKNGAARWSLDAVHEKVELAPGATVKHLAGDLLHYTCATVEEHLAVANRYTTLKAGSYAAQHKTASLAQILVAPAWCFFHDYVWRRGFLDGYYGLVICAVAAFSTFIKYVKLRQMNAGENSAATPD